jgi:hypothetical protein
MSTSRTVLGTFSKGTKGSVSVNFARSGGVHCDPSCVHHPQSKASHPTGACYAVRTEKRPDRGQLAEKLERHEALPPALIVGAALVELRQLVDRGKGIPWIRLCTNGSLPQPEMATKLFLDQLRAFLAYAKQNGVPIHLPVETNAKARFYRRHVVGLAVVRESLQRPGSNAKGPVSIVAGADIVSGRNVRRRRLAAASRMAKERSEKTHRKTIVCPAVAASFLHRFEPERIAKAKCGKCQACAQSHIDVVFPFH